jgi:NADH-quinone oxidoreductase subunit J
MMDWLQAHPMTLVGLVLWAIGILWLMPGAAGNSKPARLPRGLTTPFIAIANRVLPAILGRLTAFLLENLNPFVVVTAAGLVLFIQSSGLGQGEVAEEIMFWVFAVSALLCGVLMITARNPVYAALWFALATLATCGLFLLQSAPFLAAATIIVYAGAVIVTFLFVIMLAQQSGAAGYDQRSGQSLMATISAFVLLGAVAMTLQQEKLEIGVPVVVAKANGTGDSMATSSANMISMAPAPVEAASAEPSASASLSSEEKVAAKPGNLLSKADPDHAVGDLKGLGRSLFSDYLFAVELAGTLLLVASIGAIALAPRREQGAI